MLIPPHPFFMIRHGETDWNREGRFQGQVDIDLNELGRSQAAGNGKALASLIDPSQWAFVCSPMSRTRETMELIRENIGLPREGYSVDDRLIEVTFGDWEKHTLADIEDTWPDQAKLRQENKWEYVPPNGESYRSAAERMRPVLESLKQPTVIVTHGGIIRGMRVFIEGTDPDDTAHGATPQDQLYFYDGDEGGWLDKDDGTEV
ncbi:histidine phosphatase family protein [Ahrensia marina]|jgi:probable phosphoglycerate mutase|uniref:Phosphoglycerate mutase n=1 Tax=Ahrensia marina TaxID=1514904 RepID=A0A0N0VLP0_9HYPH|nr:histidine phosphatase family protein [Ahrensia marina]KPB01138.1 hypothetical protein SU32_09565 [Ahrensia marina]